MPTKYLLTGSIYSIVSSNTYYDPSDDSYVDGKEALATVFDLHDEKPWLLLLVSLAFTVLFRLQHLFLLYMGLHKLGKGTVAATSKPRARGDGRDKYPMQVMTSRNLRSRRRQRRRRLAPLPRLPRPA
jgi:hypothetical protein